MLIVFIAVFLIQISRFEARTYKEQEHLTNEAGQMLFEIYTRKNPTEPSAFELNDMDYLQFTNFNSSNPTKILTHGWNCYWGSAYNILLRNAFLIQYDVNVIVVSWDLESTLGYFGAKDYVPTAGQVVAYMIDLLCEKAGVKLTDVHVIGHSLGAHVAGITGLYTTVGKLPRVTGLDPAGPLFHFNDKMRISKNSAEFVDIIHTASMLEGMNDNLGHVDFYPNGGFPIQPGCGWDILGFRSHRRAYWLYASSILNPGEFLAIQCDSWRSFKSGNCAGNNVTEMGNNVPNEARGKYYLKTSDKMPYTLGKVSIVY